jgi:hypothetical protein
MARRSGRRSGGRSRARSATRKRCSTRMIGRRPVRAQTRPTMGLRPTRCASVARSATVALGQRACTEATCPLSVCVQAAGARWSALTGGRRGRYRRHASRRRERQPIWTPTVRPVRVAIQAATFTAVHCAPSGATPAASARSSSACCSVRRMRGPPGVPCRPSPIPCSPSAW